MIYDFHQLKEKKLGRLFSDNVQDEILLKLVIFETHAKECIKMICHLDEILILTFDLDRGTSDL